MESSLFYYLNFNGQWTPQLDAELIENYKALGIEEMSLEEAEVDEILGEESFCGGDLPIELIEKLEMAQSQMGKKIFFNDFVDAKKAMIFLNQLDPEAQIKLESREQEDWQENWRLYYKKVELLDGKIVILPEWDKEQPETDLLIRINPGQGFGTGTHETTQLCLEWLLDRDFKKVLDFGCGSGILGIGAQKLDSSVTCDYYDIDANALENCLDNIGLNGITDNFKIYQPDEKIKLNFNSYDLVFANILAPVLIEESKLLKSLKAPTLILSGLLEDQVTTVMSAYTDEYEVEGIKTRNQWVSLLLKRL